LSNGDAIHGDVSGKEQVPRGGSGLRAAAPAIILIWPVLDDSWAAVHVPSLKTGSRRSIPRVGAAQEVFFFKC